MDKLILADLQTLATSPDYGGRGFLQPSSAVLGLSAALFLSDLHLWQGAGYKLTDGEIDDIQAMIAQLEEDLMVTGDMYPIDKVKVTSSVSLSVLASTQTKLYFDTEIYDPEGMHLPSGNTQLISPVRDGLHLFECAVTFPSAAVGYRQLQLWHYDSLIPSEQVIALSRVNDALGTGQIQLNLSTQVDAVVGDYFWMRVYQTSPGTLNIPANSYGPFFSAVRI